MIIDEGVVPYLIKFVTNSEEHLFEVALDILKIILNGSEDQKKTVLDCEMPECLRDIACNLKKRGTVNIDFANAVDVDFIHQLCENLKNEDLDPGERSVSMLFF